MLPAELEKIKTPKELVEYALSEYESPLIGYACGILRDFDRARDVVQDTFIRLYQQDIEKVKGGLKNWLYTVCRNRALDILRKEKRMIVLEESAFSQQISEDANPSESIEKKEKAAQLMGLVSRLKPNQREVIELKFQKGMSYQQISEKTGLTSSNVGFILHHAMKQLRDMIPRTMEGQ